MDMKLSEFLIGIGRPVAYYPKLVKLVGTTNATILFCQLAYWQDKQSDPEGWIYKTSEELKEETGLTYYEQKNARKHLKDAGFLEEKYARLDHEMYFRVFWDVVNEKWGNRELSDGESEFVALGKRGSSSSLNSNAETTTENTTRESFSDPLWDLTHNKEIKSTPINRQYEKIHEVALRLEKGLRRGQFPEGAADQSVYKWILQQEEKGQSLDKWMEWAMDGRRAEFSYVYHKDPKLIKRDWMQVFSDTPKKSEYREL